MTAIHEMEQSEMEASHQQPILRSYRSSISFGECWPSDGSHQVCIACLLQGICEQPVSEMHVFFLNFEFNTYKILKIILISFI